MTGRSESRQKSSQSERPVRLWGCTHCHKLELECVKPTWHECGIYPGCLKELREVEEGS